MNETEHLVSEDYLEAIAKNTKSTCIQLNIIQMMLLPVVFAALKVLGLF
jgi:hypothetical protein